MCHKAKKRNKRLQVVGMCIQWWMYPLCIDDVEDDDDEDLDDDNNDDVYDDVDVDDDDNIDDIEM